MLEVVFFLYYIVISQNCPDMRTVFSLKLLLLPIAVVMVFLAIELISPVSAAANQEIKFQGKIVNKATGTNISPACILSGAGNDTCDFRISVYDAASGGTALWSEILTDVEIGEYNGIFNLSIGSYCITGQGGSWTADGDAAGTRCAVGSGGVDWSSDADYYIQIEFDDANTSGLNSFSSPEVFSTRSKITSVPYAMRSSSAGSLVNESGVITLNDINTGDIPFSDATYTQLPNGYNSILHVLNDISNTGGSLWTDGGTLSYLTSTTDDIAVGGNSLASAFSVDVDLNKIRIGSGSTNNGILDMYASNGATGSITYGTADRWEFSNGDVLIADNENLYLGSDADFFINYDETTDDRAEFGFGSNVFGYFDDVASQSYGSFNFSGLTTLGTALAGSQTALYINTAAGFTGKFLDIDLNGSDIFEVTATGITANVPATFASAGNVQIANNLTFTNSTASYITSDSPLYITAGDVVSDEDLILSANNAGYVVVDDRLEVTSLLHLGTNANNFLATSSQANAATDNLYWGNSLLCDTSDPNCGWGSLFTDGGAISYLTSATDDFAVGGSTLASAFSVDIDLNTVRIGTGSTANAVLGMYASDGDTGTITYNINDAWNFNGGSMGIGVDAPDSWLDILAATADSGQINLTTSAGVNPSSPVSGDLWWNGTNLYFYDGSTNNDLLVTGSTSLFTDGGSVTYLTQSTDDFAIGGTSLSAVFSVDTDLNTVRVGDGSTANGTLGMYSSNGDTGNLSYTLNDAWFFEGGKVGIGTADPLRALHVYDTSGIHIGDENKYINIFTSGTDTDISATSTLQLNYASNQDVMIGDGGLSNLSVSGNISSKSNLYIQSDIDATGIEIASLFFGGTNSESLVWDGADSTFKLSDDLEIANSLVVGENILPSLNSSSTSRLNHVIGYGGDYNTNSSTAVDFDPATGNYYVASVIEGTADFDPDNTTSGDTQTSAGLTDFAIAKYDSSHILQWVKMIGSTQYEGVTDIKTDGTNIYVTGSFQGTVDFDEDNVVANDTHTAVTTDMYLAVYNTDGVLQWMKVIAANPDSGEYQGGWTVNYDENGNIFIGGYFTGSNVDFDPDNSIAGDTKTTAGYDGFIAKYNSGGVFQWVKTYPTTTAGGTTGIENDSTGNVFVTGYFSGTNIDFDADNVVTNDTQSSAGSADVFVAKYSPAGVLSWVKTFGAAGLDSASDINIDSNGEVYVSGSLHDGTVDFDRDNTVSGDTQVIPTAVRQYVVKYSSSGVFSWVKVSTFSNLKTSLDGLGNIFVTGTYPSGTDFDPDNVVANDTPTTVGSTDLFIAKYATSTAKLNWVKTMGGLYGDQGLNITVDPANNKLYLVGKITGDTVDFEPDYSMTGDSVTTELATTDAFVAIYELSTGGDVGSSNRAFSNIYSHNYYGTNLSINNFDLAEEYEVDDMTIGAGDVVRLKPSGSKLVVERTDIAYDDGAIGVVSTDPGLYLRDWKENRENGRPVALVGRVPVKVTNENGPVNRGDYLTPSSTPGYAMKATEGGIIIGRAMESFSGVVEGDSSLVETKIEEDKVEAQELVENLVDAGELEEGETQEAIGKVEELMEDKEQATEYKKGRILMYVDLGYVPSQYYEEVASDGNGGLEIEEFNAVNGDNLFEVTDSQLVIKSDVQIGGRVAAKRYTSIEDVILQLSAQDKSLRLLDEGDNEVFKVTAQGKLSLIEGENSSIGKAVVEIGQTQVEIKNSTVSEKSRILVTPDQFVIYKVKKLNKAFIIEIQEPVNERIYFDYLIIN